jgi:Family of unknown function (DUF5694)
MQLVSSELKTNTLVLGTPHLNGLGEKYTPRLLDNVVKKLLEFRPDLICIESLPGEVIEIMKSKQDSDTLQQFVGPWLQIAPKMQKRLKLSRFEAEQTVKKMLKKKLSAKGRLELIPYMVANYDEVSAVLQWSYLPEAARQTQTVVPKPIAKSLEKLLYSPNEYYSIGVRLARKLKLQSIVPIDDHNSSVSLNLTMKQYKREWEKAVSLFTKQNKNHMEEHSRRFKTAIDKKDLLPFYVYCNSPAYSRKVWELEGKSWLRLDSPSNFGRYRLLTWEVRNLNMASHIRQAMMFHSGKKVLVVVGSSHKVFLERYLKQMLDISIVKLRDI